MTIEELILLVMDGYGGTITFGRFGQQLSAHLKLRGGGQLFICGASINDLANTVLSILKGIVEKP